MIKSFQGLETNNGCIKIPVDNTHLDRVILSSFAVSFHWKDTSKLISPVQNRLAELVQLHRLDSVDGNDPNHDQMHFDKEDAQYPALHMHIKGNIETDETFKKSIKFVISDLERKNFLSKNEAISLDMGITTFLEWE